MRNKLSTTSCLTPSATQADDRPTPGGQSFAGIDPDGIYSTRQAAPRIGQSEAFLEVRRARGLPPKFLKLGRSVKYVGRDLIALLLAGYESQGGDHD